MYVQEYGRSWSKIAKMMKKSRTRNQVKNRYNTQMNLKSAHPEEQYIHMIAFKHKTSSFPEITKNEDFLHKKES